MTRSWRASPERPRRFVTSIGMLKEQEVGVKNGEIVGCQVNMLVTFVLEG